ncbi:MAG: reverse transcriptase domain-containing protein [Nanoarchaeota archaeon]
MEYGNLYHKIYNLSNLILAWRKARKGKTKKYYVKEFEKDTIRNLFELQEELKNETYFPRQLKIFILRDPKTRKISKSDFRDRIVHHAIVNILEPIFDKSFFHDSCANRKGKGNLFALKRFELFKRQITNNLKSEAFCLKADIKHYFEQVDHEILLKIIGKRIKDEKIINLIIKILKNNTQNDLGGEQVKECL